MTATGRAVHVVILGAPPGVSEAAERALAADLPGALVTRCDCADDLVRFGAFDAVLAWGAMDGPSVERLRAIVRAGAPDVPVLLLDERQGGVEATCLPPPAPAALGGGVPGPLVPVLALELERARESRRIAGSAQRLRGLLERLRVGVFRCGLDGIVIESNLAFRDLLGISGEDGAAGMPFFEAFADRDVARQVVERLGWEGEVTDLVAELERAGGESVWVSLSVSLARDTPDGPVIDGLLEDVTARIGAAKELEAVQNRQRRMFDALAEGLLLVRPDGGLADCNRAACTLLGLDPPDLDRNLRALVQDGVTWHTVREDGSLFPVEDYPLISTLRTGLPRAGVVLGLRRTDGDLRWISINTARVDVAGDGDKWSAVVSLTDVTEHKAAEEDLRRTAEQLRQSQKLEAVGQLAGGVAHDFNNLLLVIGGYGSLLAARVAGDPVSAGYAAQVGAAAERAAALTRQLLAFSRKQVLRPRSTDLNEVISHVEKLLARLIGEDVELVTELDPDLPIVHADPGQLEQVLMNLAVNARDAMPEGGRLTLGTQRRMVDRREAREFAAIEPGLHAALVVRDQGVGMDEATAARIFEPFFTTKETGKGTGLGLSTVFGIVRQSGGDVTVSSTVGEGTEFTILLPAVDSPADDPAPPEETGELQRGDETVLLVEDDEAVRRLAREILTSNGYRVLVARDGADALAVCQDHEGPIDLLVTDVVMPRMGGRELAEHAARLKPGLRVLFVSGYADREMPVPRRAGVAQLGKPFGPAELSRTVRELLDE